MAINEEISFTRTVKEEASLAPLILDEDKKALLSGFIKINSTLSIRNTGWVILIKSDNIKIAKLILSLIKSLYGIDARVSITEQKRFKINNTSKIVHIEISSKSKLILTDLGIYSDNLGFDSSPVFILNNLDLIKYYIRGCFLATGSVNSPVTKNYHLEISSSNENQSYFISKLLRKFYIESKVIQRRSQYVTYIKKSDKIADFLKLIETNNALFYYEDIRIQRDQLNSMNRIVNCEVSNEKKAIEIGNKQASEIRWFKDNIGFDLIDKKLRIIGELRLANPESTYLELSKDASETFNMNISKSGISYRLNSLMKIISKFRGNKNG